MPDLSLKDVQAARETIAGIARHTPLIESFGLAQTLGGPLMMKLETLQPIGAFKIRGAANALSQLPKDALAKGVCAASTGNHGRAVAYAAKRLGARAVICLSELVPDVKVKAIEALGGEVCRTGRNQDEAMIEVERLVREEGMTAVSPFDDAAVIAGQGTIGLELLEDCPELAQLVVPLSGGGLIGGIALAAKAIKPEIRIVGVTMDRGAAMHESIQAGKPVEVEEFPSLADSLGGGIGLENEYTFRLCRDLLDEVVLLSEQEIYRGMRALFMEEKIVTEGGGSVGAGAILAGHIKPMESGPTAIVVSGHNVDMGLFLKIVNGEPVRLGALEVEA